MTWGDLYCRGRRMSNTPVTWAGRGDKTTILSESIIASRRLCVTIKAVVGRADQIASRR